MSDAPDDQFNSATRSRPRRVMNVVLWRSRARLRRAGRSTRRGAARTGRAIRRSAPFGVTVLATLAIVGTYVAVQPKPHALDQTDVNRSIASALASVTPPPAYSQQVYEAVAPSLVFIQVQEAQTGAPASPGASAAPGGSNAPGTSPAPGTEPLPTPAPSSGKPTAFGLTGSSVGSGVIVDDAGDILTALHVVANATAIQVTFADGTTSPAQIASQEVANDIAVLQATQPPSTIVPAVLGSPRSMQVGSEAFVLGNPFGLDGSLSAGVVSGLGRSFQMPNGGPNLTGLIQVDAAVNPGNSGGPLVNRNGEVVGIVTALINPTEQNVFIGIGLAVPIDVATSGGPGQLPQY